MSKRLFLFVILALCTIPMTSFGQKKGNRTELERFHSEKGSIVVIETEPIGYSMREYSPTVYASFWAVVVYIPGRDDKVLKGIKITVHERSTRKLITTAYIDSSEIPSLYSAMMYIMKAEAKLKDEKKDLHVLYVTKGDFSIGFKKSKKGSSFYYYRISDTENGKSVNYKFPATLTLLKSMKKNIRNGVKFLNKHHKKLKKPEDSSTDKKELNT
ncbi:hypothetical protein KKF84_18575 [Myxococcota bacterium]|nr:hypothetical protein [Myxococcota bacterium]MBU1537327.1 hypothetical protein [Myxococcota bacterium]